jgi:hypothetical protein
LLGLTRRYFSSVGWLSTRCIEPTSTSTASARPARRAAHCCTRSSREPGEVKGGIERGGGNGAEFFVGQERAAFVIEAPAIGFEIVEEDMIGAAGVGFCEDKDGGLNPLDPKLGIIWPLPIGRMSEKDMLRPYIDANFKGI